MKENKQSRPDTMRQAFKSTKSTTTLIGLVLLILLVAMRLNWDPAALQKVRFLSFDYYQQIKPREYTPQPVRIIDLDEASLQEFGQWPWPRTRIAELIDRLTQLGAVTISFDMFFAESDRLSPPMIAQDNPLLPEEVALQLKKLPKNETAMVAAMQRSRVILGMATVRQEGETSNSELSRLFSPPVEIGEDPKEFLAGNPDFVHNLSELEKAAAGIGVINFEPDFDNINRKVSLIFRVGEQIWPALSTESLKVATGGESIVINTGEHGIDHLKIAGQIVSTDAHGKIWPYYTSPIDDRYVSMGDVLNGKVDPARISGHIIFVGTSAVGLEDYRAIPGGIQVPGVGIHAEAIENILTNQFLTRGSIPEFYEIVGTFFFGLVIIILIPRYGARFSFISSLVLIGGTIALSWWFFSEKRILVDATWPVITFASLFVCGATSNYIREERKRQEIRNAFGQYLSPALVDQLGNDPDKLVLGGETRELSVLFTDVRGFTTISESYKDFPEGLTLLMNRFLSVLSQPILDHNGTIDKYMGDAIMAFWNAPVDDADHARKSCHAALDMIANVEELNKVRSKELKGNDKETFLEIKVGIGINTGDCVVGNMGSHNRFDYTALGDTVNLASRLEGQSKPYGLPIVIGAATADVVAGEFAVHQIDLIRVKGKKEPVKIYSLAGDETLAQSEDFLAFRAINSAMLSSYRSQDWDSAYEALEMMDPLGEKLGLPIEEYIFIYETRISEFRASPPGANWDGVYIATTK